VKTRAAIVTLLATAVVAAPADAAPIFTIAGIGPIGDEFIPFGAFSGDGGPATSAEFDHPLDVLPLGDGSILVADAGNHRVRRITRRGRVVTVAGTGIAGSSGDGGPARRARLDAPHGLAKDGRGGFLIADAEGNRIRRVAGGVITTFAGTGAPGFAGDRGPATSAQLASPQDVALAPDGTVLVADAGNARIRRILRDGTIHTVAGDGRSGYGGDGGPAFAASMDGPTGVAATSNGSILIADSDNNRVRRVDPDGTMRTVAGSGHPGFGGDGRRAVRAKIDRPLSVAAGRGGTFVVADSANYRIRRVSHGVIETAVGGSRFGGYEGDGGDARRARLLVPSGVALSDQREIVVADTDNNVVRLVSGRRTRLMLAILDRWRRARRHRSVSLGVRLSRPARIVVELAPRRQSLAFSTLRAGRGLTRLTLPPQPPGSYRVILTARDRGGAVATDGAIVTWSRK
jgi:NHL repeat-containing protein